MKVNVEDLERSERCHAKAAALIAGSAKLMTDFIGNASWGSDIVVDVAIELLEVARAELGVARELTNVVRSQTDAKKKSSKRPKQ